MKKAIILFSALAVGLAFAQERMSFDEGLLRTSLEGDTSEIRSSELA